MSVVTHWAKRGLRATVSKVFKSRRQLETWKRLNSEVASDMTSSLKARQVRRRLLRSALRRCLKTALLHSHILITLKRPRVLACWDCF
ncbi:uncharacterized protein BDV14DRAFT_82102 [Aspergillus stella-maris]|uniref:uncharacterized protein n=1 Tax=Aspergillus stella-maris TaxID=1810926 RepID=UPI003CCE0059